MDSDQTKFSEMNAKIDRLQTDLTEIKSVLLSVLLDLKRINEKLDKKTQSINETTYTQVTKRINTTSDNQSVNGFINHNLALMNYSNSNSESLIDGNIVPLYPGSQIEISAKRLESAISSGNKSKGSKHSVFIVKVFTSVCGVKDVYRRSRSGTASRIKTENSVEKKKFSKQLYDELIDASKFYFGKEINKDQVNKTITDKLQSLNNYLLKLKETTEIPKNIMCKVTEEDLTNFKDLELYKNNPHLFEELDREFYDEPMDHMNVVDCILDLE